MSVGKLVPKGKTTIKGLVRGKEDAPIFLHITSSEQVGASPLPSLFVLPRLDLFIHYYFPSLRSRTGKIIIIKKTTNAHFQLLISVAAQLLLFYPPPLCAYLQSQRPRFILSNETLR
jgi:hypothetical protein